MRSVLEGVAAELYSKSTLHLNFTNKSIFLVVIFEGLIQIKSAPENQKFLENSLLDQWKLLKKPGLKVQSRKATC